MIPLTLLLGVACLVAVLAGRLRRTHVIVRVEGPSMEPALRDGDRVLVRRAVRPRRGDVVLLTDPDVHPLDPSKTGRIIKRVAALPGDPVPSSVAAAVGGQAVVPPGRIVVLGDNAARSIDSRDHGYAAASDVIGVVLRPMNGSNRSPAARGRPVTP